MLYLLGLHGTPAKRVGVANAEVSESRRGNAHRDGCGRLREERREDQIPLHPALAREIEEWVESRNLRDNDFLFPLWTPEGHLRRTSKMIRRDLVRAREKWINEVTAPAAQEERAKSDFLTYQDRDGLFADFHSARHTFVTNLGKAGIHPKLAQALARHSTINLTMNVYSHVGLDEKARAVALIPAPQNHEPDRTQPPAGDDDDGAGEPAVVTDPEPQPVPSGAQIGALQLAFNGPALAPFDTGGPTAGAQSVDQQAIPKSLSPCGFGSDWQPLAQNGATPPMATAQVRPEGFEPPTLGSEDRCSIQLSYGRSALATLSVAASQHPPSACRMTSTGNPATGG